MNRATALAAKREHAATLMGIDGVVGVGVGQDGEDYVIRVYLKHEGVVVPDTIDGVRVMPEISGEIKAF